MNPTDSIHRLVVSTDAQTSVADQSIQSVQLREQPLRRTIHFFQVLEIALHPLDLAGISILGELLLGQPCVLFLHREHVHLCRVVGQQVRRDTEADAGAAAGDDKDFLGEGWDGGAGPLGGREKDRHGGVVLMLMLMMMMMLLLLLMLILGLSVIMLME